MSPKLAVPHLTRSLALAALAVALLAAPGVAGAAPVPVEDTAIRPFRINVPEAELVDLRRRVAATRWPDR